jgi:hypothetical protein
MLLTLDLVPARFRSLIQESPEPHPVLGTYCWCWLGALNRNGYAYPWIDGARQVLHRTLFELLVGPIDPSLLLDHLCRVRACVNPFHCEPVTAKENTNRGNAVLFQLTLRGIVAVAADE